MNMRGLKDEQQRNTDAKSHRDIQRYTPARTNASGAFEQPLHERRFGCIREGRFSGRDNGLAALDQLRITHWIGLSTSIADNAVSANTLAWYNFSSG